VTNDRTLGLNKQLIGLLYKVSAIEICDYEFEYHDIPVYYDDELNRDVEDEEDVEMNTSTFGLENFDDIDKYDVRVSLRPLEPIQIERYSYSYETWGGRDARTHAVDGYECNNIWFSLREIYYIKIQQEL